MKAFWLLSNAATALACGLSACGQEPAPNPHQEDSAMAPAKKVVFESGIAGTWYSDDPAALRKEIEGYLARAEAEPPLADVHALVLPHAGYRYSGQTAAWGVKQVAGKSFKRVVVIGPSHRLPLRNAVTVPDATHYRTPLGEVPLDTEMIAALRGQDFCRDVQLDLQGGEHSTQIEVPLLQVALDGPFKLVLVIVGQLDPPTTKRVADVLRSWVDAETLLVVSTDFTHYGRSFGYVPFAEDIPAKLEELDLGACRLLETKDGKGFREYVERTGATICGQHPLEVLMALLPPEAKVVRLRYDTSGRMTGDYQTSVSYVSMAGCWQPAAAAAPAVAAEIAPAPKREMLTRGERAALLKLARSTIEAALNRKPKPGPKDLGIEITPAMRERAGVFVTLTKHGELRGCIGTLAPDNLLFENIREYAVYAAVRDPRFPPVTAAELPELHLEISVLTPRVPVASYQDIVIGKHGIFLTKGRHHAVFLPQVAPEQGWDLETTLRHLALKAGLERDDWREGAMFEVFEAVVFHEGKP